MASSTLLILSITARSAYLQLEIDGSGLLLGGREQHRLGDGENSALDLLRDLPLPQPLAPPAVAPATLSPAAGARGSTVKRGRLSRPGGADRKGVVRHGVVVAGRGGLGGGPGGASGGSRRPRGGRRSGLVVLGLLGLWSLLHLG